MTQAVETSLRLCAHLWVDAGMPWREGMLAKPDGHDEHWRITWADSTGMGGAKDGWSHPKTWGLDGCDGMDPMDADEWSPDWHDMPTYGALLGLVREALDDPYARTRWSVSKEGWQVVSYIGPQKQQWLADTCATEAEALLRAYIAAKGEA